MTKPAPFVLEITITAQDRNGMCVAIEELRKRLAEDMKYGKPLQGTVMQYGAETKISTPFWSKRS
jgi:hypothetical protein